ncbi:MAG: 3-deoxy-8-phosphooctulonate synthase [Oligoflexia bacterium]|nr:3-deoxy-8-phosphooctulonate synthase [Oligoflexia bacterium]
MELYVGPCVLESEGLTLEIAHSIKEQLQHFLPRLRITFKGSYDKANRTSVHSYRGPGLREGQRILELVKSRYGFPILTDFHSVEEAPLVAEFADVMQVPAFLCRQTDIIIAGAKAAASVGATLKIKKGQFLAPFDVKNIVEKANHFLPKERIILTERGCSFGYNNLIVDMASFQIMQSFGVRAIYDATHSVQSPGSAGNSTGGKRDQILVLAKAAVAAGADGVFIETHPNPEKALSDAATSWPLSDLGSLVRQLLNIFEATHEQPGTLSIP